MQIIRDFFVKKFRLLSSDTIRHVIKWVFPEYYIPFRPCE